MFKHLYRVLSPEYYKRHIAEVDRWKQAGSRAVAALHRFPDTQQSIATRLENAHFVHGTGRAVMAVIRADAEPGSLFVMSTFSHDDFRKLAGDRSLRPNLEVGGFYNHNQRRNVGIIVMRPTVDFREADRAAVFGHELLHNDFASSGLSQAEFNLGSEPVPQHVADEIFAYTATSEILDAEYGSGYRDLEAEVLDKLSRHYTGEGPIDWNIEGVDASEVSAVSRVAQPTAYVIGLISLVKAGTIPASQLTESLGIMAHPKQLVAQTV